MGIITESKVKELVELQHMACFNTDNAPHSCKIILIKRTEYAKVALNTERGESFDLLMDMIKECNDNVKTALAIY